MKITAEETPMSSACTWTQLNSLVSQSEAAIWKTLSDQFKILRFGCVLENLKVKSGTIIPSPSYVYDRDLQNR